MKIVVSGASGLIGSALVPALEAAEHSVVRLVRREPEAPNEIAWDPPAGTIDAAALEGVEGAVNLSGATIGRRWTEKRRAEILESRVTSTDLLARTLAALEPRPGVLVSAGGVGIYGDQGDEMLTEESGLGSGFLADVGRAWEAAAEPARAAGIRVVNFRQGIVLSRKGGALQRLLTPFKLGVGGRVGSGRQWWSWVAMDDLTAAYRFAVEGDLPALGPAKPAPALLGGSVEPTPLAGPVNLASPNPATNAQFVKALGRALHRPTVFPFPRFAVATMFGEMGETVLLESQRLLPARLLDAGFAFAHPDLGEALEHTLER